MRLGLMLYMGVVILPMIGLGSYAVAHAPEARWQIAVYLFSIPIAGTSHLIHTLFKWDADFQVPKAQRDWLLGFTIMFPIMTGLIPLGLLTSWMVK